MSKHTLRVISLVSRRTNNGLVEIMVDNGRIQINPNQARKIAGDIVAAAEGAEGDAFLYNFITEELKQDDAAAAMILSQFRDYRDKRLVVETESEGEE